MNRAAAMGGISGVQTPPLCSKNALFRSNFPKIQNIFVGKHVSRIGNKPLAITFFSTYYCFFQPLFH